MVARRSDKPQIIPKGLKGEGPGAARKASVILGQFYYLGAQLADATANHLQ